MQTIVFVSGWSFEAGMWDDVLSRIRAAIPSDVSLLCMSWLDLGRWLYQEGACPVPESALQGRVIWVGWSLGGALILEAIRRGWLKPSRSVLLSTSPRLLTEEQPGVRPWVGVPAGHWRRVRQGVRRALDAALRQFDAWLRLPDSEGRVVDTQNLLAGLDWLAQIDCRAMLAAPPVPLVWIFGDDDPLLPNPAWPECLAMGADNQWLVLPHAGHGIPWSQADTIAAHITEYVR